MTSGNVSELSGTLKPTRLVDWSSVLLNLLIGSNRIKSQSQVAEENTSNSSKDPILLWGRQVSDVKHAKILHQSLIWHGKQKTSKWIVTLTLCAMCCCLALLVCFVQLTPGWEWICPVTLQRQTWWKTHRRSRIWPHSLAGLGCSPWSHQQHQVASTWITYNTHTWKLHI